jgi:hypothetical protein
MRKPATARAAARAAVRFAANNNVSARDPGEAAAELVCLALGVAVLALAFQIATIW